MGEPSADWRGQIAIQREKLGKQIADASANTSKSFSKYVEGERSVLPQAEQDRLNARDENIRSGINKVKALGSQAKSALGSLAAKAIPFNQDVVSNKLNSAVQSAKASVAKLGTTLKSSNIKNAALTATNNVAQSALSKIEQICAKYKTAGRRKKTLRKRR
jgi:hypothetical protein